MSYILASMPQQSVFVARVAPTARTLSNSFRRHAALRGPNSPNQIISGYDVRDNNAPTKRAPRRVGRPASWEVVVVVVRDRTFALAGHLPPENCRPGRLSMLMVKVGVIRVMVGILMFRV